MNLLLKANTSLYATIPWEDRKKGDQKPILEKDQCIGCWAVIKSKDPILVRKSTCRYIASMFAGKQISFCNYLPYRLIGLELGACNNFNQSILYVFTL